MTPARLLLLGLILALCLPPGAHAATQVIPGDGTSNSQKLTIYVGDAGQLQAKRGAPGDPVQGMFYGDDNGPASNYWHLRVKGEPALNQTFGPGNTVPVSNGPVTGNWTPASPAEVETVMNVEHEGVNLFQVKQTVLYVGYDLKYRVIWEVTNIDPQNRTIPFVFGTSADLYIDSSDLGRGVFIDGPSRFVGGSNEQSRTTGGLQEVTSSRLPGEANPTAIPNWASYEEGGYSAVTSRLSGADAFLNTVDPNLIDNGVGVSFNDRATAGLAPGETARYEVIWHLERPTPLSASPASAAKELPGTHTVTLSLVDANFNPVPNQVVRYQRTGANPTPGAQTVSTDAQGQAVVSWDGTTAGLDTVTGYVDIDGDGAQDPEEPAASATVRWLEDNHVAGPPSVTPPGGLQPVVQPNPANPEAPTYQFGRSAAAQAGFTACSFDQRQGANLNLPVSSTLQPGGGTISDVRLFLLDPSRHDPTNLALPLPTASMVDDMPDQSGNTYSFTIPCVVGGEMWLEFTLTEGSDPPQTFRVPIGGLQLIDPQGVVYNGAAYDQAVAAGQTPEQARSTAAIQGATVRLQRQVGSDFQNVLSGDPGITPNVNPQTTGANGIYQWDVSPGTYRVVVTADGCAQAVSAPVVIPPPVLDLHIRMDCGGSGGGGGGGGGAGSGGGGGTGSGGGGGAGSGGAQVVATPAAFKSSFLATKASAKCLKGACKGGGSSSAAAAAAATGSTYRVTVQGRFRGGSCAGRVRLGYSVKGMRAVKRTVKVGANCRYRNVVRLSVPGRVTLPATLKISQRFMGNQRIAGGRGKTLKVKLRTG